MWEMFLMPIPCGCYYHYCVVHLELRNGDIPGNSFVVWDCFSHPEFVFFHVKLLSFQVCKEFCWKFDGDCRLLLVGWLLFLCQSHQSMNTVDLCIF